MLAHWRDPIVAIATAPGRGAVGIVRVSGPDLTALVQNLLGRSLQARCATYLPFCDEQGEVIDRGLAIHFPAPHSYTGEDVLELQAHGGPVVLQLLLARCLQADAALRLAEPGEFTRRAFLNNKLDLAQAEAVADLIDASTEAAARSAARSLSGEFSRLVHDLLQGLTQLRILVEATLDFPEEEIDHLQAANAQGRLSALIAQVRQVLGTAQQGALLREGLRVVIAGQPNVGKSSLLNALAGAELAIVTPIAGTTRDKVAQTIQIEGVPVHVVDTAGLRHTQDEVEGLGIARAWDEIKAADAVLFLHDLTRMQQSDYRSAEQALSQQLQQDLGSAIPLVHVYNKCDSDECDSADQLPSEAGALQISAKTGQGLEALRQKLLQLAGWQNLPEGQLMARRRHVHALERVLLHLQTAQNLLQQAMPPLDLMAEELRLAQEALANITGAFSADDLLGLIFSQFCIGK